MSELRVALVTEGPTDAVIIEAALRCILRAPFILTTLQPEVTGPARAIGAGTNPVARPTGPGWCGVLKWCLAFAQRGASSLETDLTLPGFDLFLLHVDADVAGMSYADGGDAMVEAVSGLPPLPCVTTCPPADLAADAIRTRIEAWLGLAAIGNKAVLCVPSKAIEAWLAAAVLEDRHALRAGLECNLRLEAGLATLKKGERIKKGTREYRRVAPAVTTNWARVTAACTQAVRFEAEVCASRVLAT